MNPNGYLGLEVRHLAALDAVARHGSFSAAAVELGYTQSAVSGQIAALERRTGARLFVRGGGSREVSLTPAGEVVLRHARAITARMAAMRADLDAVLAPARSLSVGFFQSVGARVIPEVLTRFGRTHPDVEVRLVERQQCELLDGEVAEGTLDVAFTILPVEDDRLVAESLIRDEHLLVVPRGSPLAARAPVAGDLDGLPLVGYLGCRGQLQLEDAMAARGMTANVVRRADDNALVQALVATTVGAALMPRLCFDAHDERVVALDASALVPPREIGLVRQAGRDLGEVLDGVVLAAREVCARLAAAPVG
jgi:DNA-binding transcriptional LysR family regulator